MTKARREAAMTQMAEARKRAVAVRGEARTAFVKILRKSTESVGIEFYIYLCRGNIKMIDLAMQATKPARLSPVITAWGENALHIANHCLGRVIIG